MKINSRKWTLLCAAAVVMLGSASLAHAQSDEFRNGYDQGYRDGLEAQKHTGQGGPAGRIVIDEAHYGAREVGFCHPTEVIQQMAGWRRHVIIPVNNELCGDPAPNVLKHLEVRFHCGDRRAQRVEASETETIKISCEQ